MATQPQQEGVGFTACKVCQAKYIDTYPSCPSCAKGD